MLWPLAPDVFHVHTARGCRAAVRFCHGGAVSRHPASPPAVLLQAGARTYGQQLAGQGGQSTQMLLREGAAAGVAVAMYESPSYDLAVPALPVARLSVTLTANRVFGGLEGDRRCHFVAPRHSLFLTPAGAGAHWRKDDTSRHLNLYFDAGNFTDPLFDRAPWCADTPVLNARVPGLGALAEQLVLELQQPGPLASEAADSLARLMLVMLARHRARPAAGANPLSAIVMLRLRDYVQAHLAERILVKDLAAVAQLPVNRLTHAFATHVGLPPHRYVLMLRLQHAQELLLHSSASLADVAAACGFSSQQHRTHTMRQRLGTTPGRCRTGPRSVGGQAG
jgi:AraC-like DNA-binding protein